MDNFGARRKTARVFLLGKPHRVRYHDLVLRVAVGRGVTPAVGRLRHGGWEVVKSQVRRSDSNGPL